MNYRVLIFPARKTMLIASIIVYQGNLNGIEIENILYHD